MVNIKELLIAFLKKEPYSRLRPVAKYGIHELLRALNWAAASEILNAFYELGLDKTLKTPKSTMEVALEHSIEDTIFLHEFLRALVKMRILDEAAGRFKLKIFIGKLKKPSTVDVLQKTPMRAIFEVIRLTGDNIIDVLMTGKRELKWLTDAAIAFEPLEFSPQLVMLRLKTLEILYKGVKERLKISGVEDPVILTIGLASGFGLVNVAQFFQKIGGKIIALDPSEREVRLAEGLLEDFGLNEVVNVDIFDISKSLHKSAIVSEFLKNRDGFDAVISIERWRFYDSVMRSQILANIAFHMALYGSLVDFDFVKEQILFLNTVLYTIEGWRGFLAMNEKREMFSLVFQKIKERAGKMIIRADLPLVKGIWL